MTSPDTVMRRYSFKLYPNRKQEASLQEQSRMMAQLWNAALQRREDVYRREGRALSAYELSKEIKYLRAAMPEWAALNADTPAKVISMLDEAFQAFFKRAKRGDGAASGYPRYKRIADGMAIPFREMGKGWRMTSANEIAAKAAMGKFSPRAKAQTIHNLKGLDPHRVQSSSKCGSTEGCLTVATVKQGVQSSSKCGSTEGIRGRQTIKPRVQSSSKCGSTEGKVSFDASNGAVQSPSKRGSTEGNRSWHQDSHPVQSSSKRNMTPTNWCLYIKGVTGLIRMRGKFPYDPVSIRDSIIMFRDGSWWLSVVAKMEPHRIAGTDQIKISFKLIDEFARVERAKGRCPACSQEQIRPKSQQANSGSANDTSESGSDDKRLNGHDPRISANDTPKSWSMCDDLQSRRDLRFKKFSWRWRQESKRIARRKALESRRRRHRHHQWTNSIVKIAGNLTIVTPDIKTNTQSPRGDSNNWGAVVSTVSSLNRHILNQAPALAIQMLTYKAEESGIRCDVIIDKTPDIAVGADLMVAGKTQRRVRRQIKKEMSNV